jgi:hypothetical protein
MGAIVEGLRQNPGARHLVYLGPSARFEANRQFGAYKMA